MGLKEETSEEGAVMNNESQKLIFGMSTHHNKQNKVTPNSRKPRLEKANRDQVVFKTVNVERLVEDNHPVRAIWEFVERLDLSSFYMRINAVEGVAGRRAIDPQTLISVWIYAYSKGIGSAREISKLCEYDPAFQWLTGMEVINHHTLSDFRINYKEALDDLFKQVLGLLSAENLITLERVMHDGTKIKANAGSDSFRREDKVRAHLKMAEEHIQNMADPTEESHGERSSKARQRAVREKKERLELALNELEKIRAKKPNQEAKHEARVSQTDPEARVMKQSNGGYGPSYNVQISTDRAKGIIVGVDATQEGNDCNQLLPAVEKVQENMGHEPHQMVADGGYTNRESIMAMKEKDVDFIGSMPTGSDEPSVN
jgi:transposase